MEKLDKLISTAVPLPIEDIDTDQIIPARFLKAVSKDGFGKNLFRDWRYNQDDSPVKDFILNNNTYYGRFWSPERILAAVPVANMPHGHWQIMDLKW